MKKKRLLSLVMAAAMLFGSASALPEGVFGGSASAAEDHFGNYKGLKYYTEYDGTWAIIEEYKGTDSVLNIPSNLGDPYIKWITISYDAFKDCKTIKKVSLPNNVRLIDTNAFEGCVNLESIDIKYDGKYKIGFNGGVFKNCKKLKSIVTNSANGASFLNCESLESVTFVGEPSEIGSYAFENCKSLKKISIPDSVKKINDYAFYGCSSLETIKLGNNVKSLGDYSFQNCTSLSRVQLGSGVETLGNEVFSGCTSLKSINIPDSVTSIGNKAFKDCSELSGSIALNKTESIGSEAFSNCKKLKEVSLSEGLQTIGAKAFENCESLQSISIPKGVKTISIYTFSGCKKLSSVSLTEGITSIDDEAFKDCEKLAEIDLPDSLEKLGYRAFYGCSSLRSVAIPSKVSNISVQTFYGCKNLSEVTLSENVMNIDQKAFFNCESLKEISIPKSAAIEYLSLGYRSDDADVYGAVKVNGFKIKCYEGSSAEDYAKDNEFEYEYLTCFKHEYKQKEIPQTCTRGSYILHTCIHCGDSYISDEKPAPGHKFGPWNRNYPTEQKDGLKYRFCIVCGERDEDQTIDKSAAHLDYVVTYSNTVKIVGCLDKDVQTINIPSEIEGYPVTAITNDAFAHCKQLSSLTMPDTIETIGKHAFYDTSISKLNIPKSVSSINYGCLPYCIVDQDNEYYCSVDGAVFNKAKTKLISCPSNAKEYTIPDGVEVIGTGAFSGMDEYGGNREIPSVIEKVVIPSSVKEIGENAFYYSNLKSVNIPNSVSTIGEFAFAYTNLESVTVPGTVKKLGGYAFFFSKLKNVVLKEGITEIPQAMLADTLIKDIRIPSTVKSIGERAFEACEQLESITIPSGVNKLGQYVFHGCRKLKDISLLNSHIKIGNNCFLDTPWYYSLKQNSKDGIVIVNGTLLSTAGFTGMELTIPSSVHSVMVGALLCSAEKINIPASVTYIAPGAFANTYGDQGSAQAAVSVDPRSKYFCSVDGVLYNKEKTKLLYYPYTKKGFNILSSVKVIGSYSCESLWCGQDRNSSFTIPNGITEIENRAFSFAVIGEKLIIPGTVKTIGDSAFYDADLNSLVIKEGVESIGNDAFFGVDGLKSISIAKSVKNIGINGLGALYGDAWSDAAAWLREAAENDPMVIVNGTLVLINGEDLKDEVLKIPEGVTHIASGAFYGTNNKITLIDLPESLLSIGDKAFYNCNELEIINIPRNVQYIGEKAFGYNVRQVTKINSAINASSPNGNAHSEINSDISDNNTVKNEKTQMTCHFGTAGEKYAVNNHIDYMLVENDISKIGFDVYGTAYTGKPVKPVVEINLNGKALKEGKDYKLTCSDNTQRGEGKFKITGIGKFTGTYEGTFKIGPQAERLAGDNRFKTAVDISKSSFPSGAKTVVLAYGLNYADALAGVPLAEKLNAPILLTHTKTLPDETLDEIKRLGTNKVVILGGTGAIDKTVENMLRKNGLKTERIAGKTRFETAAKIAEKLQKLNGKTPESVFFVYYNGFADALSVSTAAAVKGAPIIYLTTDGKINSDTEAYLNSVKGNVKKAYIIGGTGVISDAMMKNAANTLGLKSATRVAGKDRFATCVAVNEQFKDVLDGDRICIATGMDFPDALAGGVFAAKNKAPLFLINGKASAALTLSDQQRTYLKTKAANNICVFGGIGVVPDKQVSIVSAASA